MYAFCRLLDDAVDNAPDSDTQSRALDHYQNVLDACYTGRLNELIASTDRPYAGGAVFTPRDASDERVHSPTKIVEKENSEEAFLALIAFSTVVRECDVPQTYFKELIAGCRMDVDQDRYADWPALEIYCYRVAGVVGLIMSRVFTISDPQAERAAIAMGNAMQLTNILRDVGEDFGRGRVYLPQDELAKFDVTEDQLRAGRVDENFRALMRFQIDRARALYREGFAGLRALPPDGSRLTASAMATLYGGILEKIELADYDVFSRRVHLTRWEKFRRLPAAWRRARRDDRG